MDINKNLKFINLVKIFFLPFYILYLGTHEIFYYLYTSLIFIKLNYIYLNKSYIF